VRALSACVWVCLPSASEGGWKKNGNIVGSKSAKKRVNYGWWDGGGMGVRVRTQDPQHARARQRRRDAEGEKQAHDGGVRGARAPSMRRRRTCSGSAVSRSLRIISTAGRGTSPMFAAPSFLLTAVVARRGGGGVRDLDETPLPRQHHAPLSSPPPRLVFSSSPSQTACFFLQSYLIDA
jgi:hypothetical protein